MIDYIYCLYEVETKTKFYIGRTIDPHRRLYEHRLGSKNYRPGDEDKYQYAQALDALGIEWDLQILAECKENTDGYEDFYVNKFRHEPLQNMRAGDSEPWMGRDYSTPEELLAAKQHYLEQAKIKPVKEKRVVESDPDKMLFAMDFDQPHKKFVAPAFERLQKDRHNRYNKYKKA